jgi:hypothetical protein
LQLGNFGFFIQTLELGHWILDFGFLNFITSIKEKSPIILKNGGLGIFLNHKLKTSCNPIP